MTDITKEEMVSKVVGMCNRVSGSTTWNAAEWMYDELVAALKVEAARPEAWPIATDDQVEALARECDWDNRKHMTPKDYAIWCERMRKFARLSAALSRPIDPKAEVEPVAKQWRAVEYGDPRTSWNAPDRGDLRGWEAWAEGCNGYEIEWRNLYASPSIVAPVGVKPLIWDDRTDGDDRNSYANTSIGRYEAFEFRLKHPSFGEKTFFGWRGHWTNADQPTESFEAAKAAAQSDFETRILSALTSSPGHVTTPGEAEGPFHVSQTSDGKDHWYSARDAASGVSIPGKSKENAEALVYSLNRAFDLHLRLASASSPGKDGGQGLGSWAKEHEALGCLIKLLDDEPSIGDAEMADALEKARCAWDHSMVHIGKDGGQEVEAVERWLVEEELPSGSKRWEVFEHELHARNVAARYNHRNKTTVTPLYTSPQPAGTALVEAASFLADRLDEFERELSGEDSEALSREYYGHVHPALSRLVSALSASTSREGER